MVHLVPCRTTYTARQVAELMFEHVYKLHGLPRKIISDRDSLFTSIFWKRLHELIGTKLGMSSAYHPQSDGATERANRTITQMLQQCVAPNQRDWVAKLPAIKFALNSARSESTGYAPFLLNSGQMPRSMVWSSKVSEEYPAVRVFARQRRLALIEAHDSILEARVKQVRAANRRRRPEPFKEGDLAYVSTKNLTFEKGLARKLIPKYIGPYKLLKDYGNHSFKVDLPSSFIQRGVHPVFHSSLLRIHVPNDDRRFPGRLDSQLKETPDAEEQWKIEKIVSHSGAREHALFKVQWSTGDVTWMPYQEISGLPALLEYLDLVGVKDISNLSKGPKEDPEEGSGDENLRVASIAINSDFSVLYSSDDNLYKPTQDSISTPPSRSSSPLLQSSLSDLPDAPSHPSSPIVRCSALSFDNVPMRYNEGHGPGACRCCARLSKSVMEYTFSSYREPPRTVRVPALAINMYFSWNMEARRLGRFPDWSPDASYSDFAYTFNECVESHKFVIPSRVNRKDVLKFIEHPSPPPSKFGVEIHQCFEGELLLPDHISIHRAEYESLQRVATEAALRENRFRTRSFREKAERRAQRGATGHAAGGFATFVDPNVRARQEAKQAMGLFYDPSTSPALSSTIAGTSSSSKKRSKKVKSNVTDQPPTTTPSGSSGAVQPTVQSASKAKATPKAKVDASQPQPAVTKIAAAAPVPMPVNIVDELDSLLLEETEGESGAKKMDTSSG